MDIVHFSKDPKEHMNKSFNEVCANRNKQWTERKKTVLYMQVEMDSLKKIQTEIILEIKNLGSQIEASGVNFTKKAEDTEQEISGIEDKVEEMEISVKENVKSENNYGAKYPGNLDTMKRLNLQIKK